MANVLSSSKKSNHKKEHIRIVAGLILGLVCGLFLGDYAGRLAILGDIYIGLLQMTVLPYIVFALIAYTGQLNFSSARFLAREGILILLLLWSIGGIVLLLLALSFPTQESGSFFSTSMIAEPSTIDFVKLFIPDNPFRSLSESAIPAVVLFCLLFGVAAIGYGNKADLLARFDDLSQILHRVNSLVMRLTPLGVFGIAANTAGTMTLDEFGRVQAYMLTLAAGTLLVTTWILPMLVAVCTPFRYRQILDVTQDAILTAFVTGSIFVVIPLLVDAVNELFDDLDNQPSNRSKIPDLVLPLAYTFPDIGKILSLIFVVFAAWFYGNPLHVADYALFYVVGLFMLFAKVIVAIPTLLALLHIPSDIFQLFLTVGVIMRRFADVAGAMHLFTFTVLTTAAMNGILRIRWNRAFAVSAITLLMVVTVAMTIRFYLSGTLNDQKHVSVIMKMDLLRTKAPHYVVAESGPNPIPLKPGQSRLDRIRERGIIRVGFLPDALPYSFYNTAGQLVGFDIELVHQLARDMRVSIEFVPYRLEKHQPEMLARLFEADHFDIAVSGITAYVELFGFEQLSFSKPYLTVNMALVVPDYRIREFSDEDRLRRSTGIKVGVKGDSYFATRIEQHFPNFEVARLNSERDFFELSFLELDALVTTAEGGAAWTLEYPGYSVVNPLKRSDGVPVVVAIGGHDLALETYLDNWLTLKKMDGTIGRSFDHWILGKPSEGKAKRWSIIRDVLHWVD